MAKLSPSGGMAGVTGLAVVGVSANIYMLVIHLIFAVRMAIDTGEFKDEILACPQKPKIIGKRRPSGN